MQRIASRLSRNRGENEPMGGWRCTRCMTLNPTSAERCCNQECRLELRLHGKPTPSKPADSPARAQDARRRTSLEGRAPIFEEAPVPAAAPLLALASAAPPPTMPPATDAEVVRNEALPCHEALLASAAAGDPAAIDQVNALQRAAEALAAVPPEEVDGLLEQAELQWEQMQAAQQQQPQQEEPPPSLNSLHPLQRWQQQALAPPDAPMGMPVLRGRSRRRQGGSASKVAAAHSSRPVPVPPTAPAPPAFLPAAYALLPPHTVAVEPEPDPLFDASLFDDTALHLGRQ